MGFHIRRMLSGLPPWPTNQSWKLTESRARMVRIAPSVVHQTPHDRTRCQGPGALRSLSIQLSCGVVKKAFEAVEGCADGEAEIQLPQIAPLVHEQVRVLLGQKVLERSHLAHESEEVGVIEEENVQPHLDVVTALIHPTAHLAAHEGTGFVEIYLMARIHEVHCSGEAGEAGTNDRDPHMIWSTKATLMYERS